MDIASMVLGIIFIIPSFFPICNFIVIVPGIVGFILGIIELLIKLRKNGNIGFATAGVLLNGIILVYTIYSILNSYLAQKIINTVIDM